MSLTATHAEIAFDNYDVPEEFVVLFQKPHNQSLNCTSHNRLQYNVPDGIADRPPFPTLILGIYRSVNKL